MTTQSSVIVALDFHDSKTAMNMARNLDPKLCRVKVGKELFTSSGPQIIEGLNKLGFDVFLDLKFHDIPRTTSRAVLAAARLGVWMINIHASGGRQMMESCREALDKVDLDTIPLLIAVTILTSLNQSDLREIGFSKSPKKEVVNLALLASQSGMDGIVCSGEEATTVRDELDEISKSEKPFCLVTPGIRLESDDKEDQKRILTPVQAIKNGSDYLVIGSSIVKAENPVMVLEDILSSIDELKTTIAT